MLSACFWCRVSVVSELLILLMEGLLSRVRLALNACVWHRVRGEWARHVAVTVPVSLPRVFSLLPVVHVVSPVDEPALTSACFALRVNYFSGRALVVVGKSTGFFCDFLVQRALLGHLTIRRCVRVCCARRCGWAYPDSCGLEWARLHVEVYATGLGCDFPLVVCSRIFCGRLLVDVSAVARAP